MKGNVIIMRVSSRLAVASILAILMFNCTNIYAFDEVSQQAVYNITQNNTRVVEGEGLHKEVIDSKIYIKDANGNILYGWQYDSNGNLYYADESGALITNGYNADDCYFDENGVFISDNGITDEDYANMERGGLVYMPNKALLYDAYCDYMLNYDLSMCNRKVMYHDYGDKLDFRLLEPADYDRESVKQQIINSFGSLTGNTVEENLYEACNKVSYSMNYNLDYNNAKLIDSVNARQGVCWHFCKSVKVLMEEKGVKTELLYVRERETNSQHVILRCLSGDKWIYCDPTFAQVMGLSDSNINYRELVSRYILDKYVHYE